MQFSLRVGLIAVAGVSVACAGLVYANLWWASLFLSLAVLLAATALAGALVARGVDRAQWIGCLVFGGGYLTLVYGWHVDRVVGAALITTRTLEWAEPKMQRSASSRAVQPASIGSNAAPVWAGWPPQAPPIQYFGGGTVYVRDPADRMLPQWTSFQQVGHSFISMVAAVLGAVAAAAMARKLSPETPA